MYFYSLKNQKEFDLVNIHGKKISTPYFITVIAKNFSVIEANIPHPTFIGMKVNKKISKKACIRNKIKRRIRHLIRLIMTDQELNLSKTAIIFIPYKNFELIKFQTLLFTFKRVLQKSL